MDDKVTGDGKYSSPHASPRTKQLSLEAKSITHNPSPITYIQSYITTLLSAHCYLFSEIVNPPIVAV
jgi:hypothetical protein